MPLYCSYTSQNETYKILYCLFVKLINPRCKCMMWKWQYAKRMFANQTQTVHKATSTVCMSKHVLCSTDSASTITLWVTCFSRRLRLVIWWHGICFHMQIILLTSSSTHNCLMKTTTDFMVVSMYIHTTCENKWLWKALRWNIF